MEPDRDEDGAGPLPVLADALQAWLDDDQPRARVAAEEAMVGFVGVGDPIAAGVCAVMAAANGPDLTAEQGRASLAAAVERWQALNHNDAAGVEARLGPGWQVPDRLRLVHDRATDRSAPSRIGEQAAFLAALLLHRAAPAWADRGALAAATRLYTVARQVYARLGLDERAAGCELSLGNVHQESRAAPGRPATALRQPARRMPGWV